jgi:hypothetical protein
MVLIIEILMLIAGLVALVKGEIPRWVLGKKSQYEVKGMGARLMGLVMILPLPCAFTSGMVLGASGVLQQGNLLGAAGVELLIVIIFGLLAIGLFYMNRQPLSMGDDNTQPPMMLS